VRDGDLIALDVEARRLDLDVAPDELERRRGELKPRQARYTRGWTRIFTDHVRQADEGADLDVLDDPGETPEPEIN
jgi:dihydroxy-acid dehydratase